MIKYSVIIPVYNIEKYIRKSVESVLDKENGTEFEVILVDDGSTDSSGEICDTLAKENRRVRVIHQENGWVSKA
jgi:glycosyltransferase involved in cell wall biosynthesis